ncbi:OPT oligopeptide transporter protein-domain-containing protein [Amanita rubescens]|nr:OPT oligopeptide transporter protein-domain-containing protein [Amanita rubescens]
MSSTVAPPKGEANALAVTHSHGEGLVKTASTYTNDEKESLAKEEIFVEKPIISTGEDVSRFVVDLRDDEDDALTFRSMVLGTVFAGLGAALCQIYLFKPVQMNISSVFLLLFIYSCGIAWAALMPHRENVVGTRFEFLGPAIHFINPGKFTIKEHVIASLVASTASNGSTAVMNFAAQRLYYDTKVEATTAVLATFSTACFGYGLVGLLRPLTVYPSEMVYWSNLPAVTVFQALHNNANTSVNVKRIKLFWTAFTGMFIFEVIPSYIFPLLNSINIFCLASQRASENVVNVFTNIFGGAGANEGLGLLSLSLDWQYIGSTYSKSFPMLSTSVFSANGSVYDQAAVFGSSFQVNQTALAEVGLPYLTGSFAWQNLASNLAIGGLIAHVFLFWGGYAKDSFKSAFDGTQSDPHYQANSPIAFFWLTKKYKEAPMWWYAILLVLAFVAGLVVVIGGQTTLPWWSYIVALILGAFVTPFSTLLFARMGNGIDTTLLMKMVAGAINPGRPVANLYFSMWSHDVVATSINLAGDLKIGQYLKIPPRVMFLTQVWGTILGAMVNYVVMVSIVTVRREILLDPIGNNVWSGQYTQTLNTNAVTWSLAKKVYGRNGPYFIVPMGLAIGMGPTFFQWLIWKRWPKIGLVRVDSIILPIIYMYTAALASGVNSIATSTILVGLASQLWLRRYHPKWYRDYNYILGGGLDGGAQVMIFILSFAVFGASGTPRPFPAWAGNPAKGNIDYCNGNGALS